MVLSNDNIKRRRKGFGWLYSRFITNIFKTQYLKARQNCLTCLAIKICKVVERMVNVTLRYCHVCLNCFFLHLSFIMKVTIQVVYFRFSPSWVLPFWVYFSLYLTAAGTTPLCQIVLLFSSSFLPVFTVTVSRFDLAFVL